MIFKKKEILFYIRISQVNNLRFCWPKIAYSLMAGDSCLEFNIIAECDRSNARTGIMKLKHYNVETPVFMPVGTQGTMKGLLPDQLEKLDCQIILGNTYHLGVRPGPELLEKAGGLHKFMGWNRALLTDSGGFQMVSLLELAEITEHGVKFKSPYGANECMLTPEESIRIQNAIGADIIMQLDDVIHSQITGARSEEAVYRTTRWLDRCLSSHERSEDQALFPIVQGTTDAKMRKISAEMQKTRDVKGYAIGGLSGGESKDVFWKMVLLSTNILPKDKPRYLMGVGYSVDMIVSCALGVDMFDCVFPTRTARFGCGLIPSGQINLKKNMYKFDFQPIDRTCECSTCKRYTRAYLHSIVTFETVACHLVSVHNIHFQMSLMKVLRKSIEENQFPVFVRDYMAKAFPDKSYPKWVIESLRAVNIELTSDECS